MRTPRVSSCSPSWTPARRMPFSTIFSRSSKRSLSSASSIRYRRPCSSLAPRACPTSTPAPSCGTSAWSIQTIGGPSTSPCAKSSSARSSARTRVRYRTHARTVASSCTSRTSCCACGASSPRLFVGRHYAALRAAGRSHASRHVCAFARVAEGATLVIAAPVLIASLLEGATGRPVGSDVWRDDWLPVPGEAGRTYRDIFTRQELTSEVIDGRAGLRLRDVFGDLPVGRATRRRSAPDGW